MVIGWSGIDRVFRHKAEAIVSASTAAACPRYIVAYKLCPTMAAADVTAPLNLALQASGLNQVPLDQRPRLLSDNGPSYVASELADWLDEQGKRETRGKPYQPMTPGKIERWHLSLKSLILLKNYYLPGDLEHAVAGLRRASLPGVRAEAFHGARGSTRPGVQLMCAGFLHACRSRPQ